MKKTTLGLLGALTLGSILSFRSAEAQDRYGFAEHAAVAASNVLFNGLISGIGAAAKDKSFFNGFAEGALGGALIFSGKYMVSKEGDLAWPAKLVNSLGTSITYNAARGRNIFDSFGLELGPVYLALEKGKESHHFNWYLIPENLVGLVSAAVRGSEFNLETSLRYGVPIFYEDIQQDSFNLRKNQVLEGFRYGMPGSNVFVLDRETEPEKGRHELLHGMEGESYRALDGLLLSTFSERYTEIHEFLSKFHIKIEKTQAGSFFYVSRFFFPYKCAPEELEARLLSGYPTRE